MLHHTRNMLASPSQLCRLGPRRCASSGLLGGSTSGRISAEAPLSYNLVPRLRWPQCVPYAKQVKIGKLCLNTRPTVSQGIPLKAPDIPVGKAYQNHQLQDPTTPNSLSAVGNTQTCHKHAGVHGKLCRLRAGAPPGTASPVRWMDAPVGALARSLTTWCRGCVGPNAYPVPSTHRQAVLQHLANDVAGNRKAPDVPLGKAYHHVQDHTCPTS